MALVTRCSVDADFRESYEQLFSQFTKFPFSSSGYNGLRFLLHKYCKVQDQILVFGCETFSLIEELYDAGYHFATAVDSSAKNACISKERNKEKRPELKFVEGHILQADLDAYSFSVLVDRGVLDTQYRGQNTNSDATKYFEEIHRLLKVGARYLCFTSAPAVVFDWFLDYFSSGWFVRVHWLPGQMLLKESTLLPLFLFVLTKNKFAGSTDHSMNIFELCLNGLEQRVKSLSEIKSVVQEIQQYFVTKQFLEKLSPGRHVKIELYSSLVVHQEIRDEPRYSLTVVDFSKASVKNGVFAIFIVPQGRETEWLFASTEGQREVACNAGFERLVIVALGRRHSFTDMDSIKKELSTKVMELAPNTLSSDTQVPFLSIGDDLGSRVVLHEGNSPWSGDYVVEDVDGDGGHKFRRLIFLSNKNVIQSEARIVPVEDSSSGSSKKKKHKLTKKLGTSSKCRVDHGYLACQHHQVIVTGLAWIEGFLNADDIKKCLLIGLGGGGLAMFLHDHFKLLSLEVVELDPSMYEIATNWFEFKEDERMKVLIADGLVFIKDEERKSNYHVIIFDVDSKDTSVGMSCPPQSFVDKTFLAQVQALLHPSGVFILSLVCRNTALRDQVLADLHTVFSELYSIKSDGLVNEIIMALPQRRYQLETDQKNSQEVIFNSIQEAVKELQQFAKAQTTSWDSSLNLCKLAEGLKII